MGVPMISKVINTFVLTLSFGIFAAFLPPTLQAQETQFFYTVNGESWTWTLPMTPTPYAYDPLGFALPSVLDDPGGGTSGLYQVYWTSANAGGLTISSLPGFTPPVIVDFYLPATLTQFFTGTTANPVFNVYGTFNSTDAAAGGAPATLVISAVGVAVPEPSTYLTLAGCLLLGAVAVAKKKKKSKAQA